MTEETFSSSKILKTKCGECSSICAIPPVSEEAGYFYCGRCRPKATPNRSFEEAAEKVLFPCPFECEDSLAWGQVLEHEVLCKKRTVVCPFGNCTTTMSLQGLNEHMKTYHKSFYQESPKQHQLSIGTLDLIVRLNCIAFDKFVFLFFIRLERKADILYFDYNVFLVSPQGYDQKELNTLQLRMEIEVPNFDLNITKLIHGRNINVYRDRFHCVNCLYQKCDKKLHENKCNWITNQIPVNVKEHLETDIFYTIIVYKNETPAGNSPEYLECPNCKNYMTEEIYLCGNGHSICGTCAHGNRCTVCSSNMQSSRNFALENLVKHMNVPCRKKCSGCTFIGLVTAVKVHENSCKYNMI
ncbi:unnamed protein product [Acanthoscelides obtectus]|uniref:E3 ubiquitin-protein ligase Sina-like RING finger domain-containing protein n=1 Tax=Acanthoscelides obtectus TaxID=200917 RepID=A0A9P0P8C2_ACAOB|nr:unnamed protein product [Acanthoscelides obtectus]CAK1677189.1 E3 ubiquitin-protein ligase SINAT5 [Acanthoscelides obtectus]